MLLPKGRIDAACMRSFVVKMWSKRKKDPANRWDATACGILAIIPTRLINAFFVVSALLRAIYARL